MTFTKNDFHEITGVAAENLYKMAAFNELESSRISENQEKIDLSIKY